MDYKRLVKVVDSEEVKVHIRWNDRNMTLASGTIMAGYDIGMLRTCPDHRGTGVKYYVEITAMGSDGAKFKYQTRVSSDKELVKADAERWVKSHWDAVVSAIDTNEYLVYE